MPKEVRIDSGDLKKLAIEIHEMVKDKNISIYPSGDMTPELLQEFEVENIWDKFNKFIFYFNGRKCKMYLI